MNDNPIVKFRQDLHDAYFEDRDQELLDFLRFESETPEEQEKELLREVAGVDDPEVLNKLQQAGISSASMTAFMLLPLVRLAWADANIQGGEFESILKAATEDGIAYGTPAYLLLNRWLKQRPTDKMLNAWWSYAQALAHHLDEPSLAAFRRATLGRAQRVLNRLEGCLVWVRSRTTSVWSCKIFPML